MRVASTKGQSMGEAVAAKIEELRTRLTEIDELREGLPENDTGRRQELLDEEHKLEARLAELEDQVAVGETGIAEKQAARQTDLTHTPKLPDSEP